MSDIRAFAFQDVLIKGFTRKMEIRPFKALRFDAAVVGNAGDCVAPPYDVIDEQMQEALYARNPCNVVRLTMGMEQPDDNERENRYSRAAEFLQEFIDSGALKAEATECMYAYVQDFDAGGRHYRRSGLVTLGKLSDFGNGVQPHERTLESPKADRLKLTRATGAQFGQLFMLYDDPEKTAENIIAAAAARPALLDFDDDNGVRHRLFLIDDMGDIGILTEMMADKMIVIADGHHRYETALNYYAETGDPAAQYCMMTLVNMRNEGLIILPTHRLVSALAGFDIDDLVGKIQEGFEVTPFPFNDDDGKAAAQRAMLEKTSEMGDEGANAFGIYAASGCFYAASLREPTLMEALCPQMSRAARTLDANVLHKLVLEQILGIGDRELTSQSHVEYIKDIDDAIDRAIARVDSGAAQVVFFMNPTRIEQVRAVAAAGEKMPQKSTFFYPKMFTGLVINKL